MTIKKTNTFYTYAVCRLHRCRAWVVENTESSLLASIWKTRNQKRYAENDDSGRKTTSKLVFPFPRCTCYICCDSDNLSKRTRRVFVSGRLGEPTTVVGRISVPDVGTMLEGYWLETLLFQQVVVRPPPPSTAKSVQVCPSPPDRYARDRRYVRIVIVCLGGPLRGDVGNGHLLLGHVKCARRVHGAADPVRIRPSIGLRRRCGGPREKPLVVKKKKKTICPTDRRNSAFPSLCSPGVGKPPLQPLLHIETARRRAVFSPRRIAFRCVFVVHSSTVPAPTFLIHVYFVFPFVSRSKFSAAANSNEQRRAR